jgi:hypothetical protein
MAELFTRAQNVFGGAFSADLGKLTLGAGLTGTLVQNLNATYMQNVSRLYEVGDTNEASKVYYVGGRAQGQMGMARVVGPAVVVCAFYEKFGDVCNAGNNLISLELSPLACNAGNLTYNMKFVVLVQVGLSVAAQDMLVNENSSLMFSGLECVGN